MKKISLLCLLWLAVALGTGCADDAPPVGEVDNGQCLADGDCPSGSFCQSGECVLVTDTGQDEDNLVPDASEDLGRPDLPGEDEDMGPPPPQIGDPCDNGDDCPSGYCIEVGDGTGRKVCTDFCVEGSCPPDYVCASVANSGADRTFLCFPEQDFLCMECQEDADCGGLSDLCLGYTDGSFCGRSCRTRECPEGYQCTEVTRGEEQSLQCRRLENYCSACLDLDGDGYGIGDCLGLDCDEEDPLRHQDAEEICDGADNNCNDLVDEGFDLTSDPQNCGACGQACAFDNAAGLCVDSQCALGPCDPDQYDLDGRQDNGCEYFCEISNEGAEACDSVDNDCDGQVDEGFDFSGDPENCGQCGRACSFANAQPACVEGDCAIGACDELHHDINRDPDDGCEYTCAPTRGGVEACDEIDNDCDGQVDEDFDLGNDLNHCGACNNVCPQPEGAQVICQQGQCALGNCAPDRLDCNGDYSDGCEASRLDPMSCLACGNVCSFANAEPGCNSQGCFLQACLPGWYNANGDPADGCEYPCTLTQGGVEVCDEIDNDCDGDVDEGIDTSSDLQNCGQCGDVCQGPARRQLACTSGQCVVGACEPGYHDADGRDDNGCEYRCDPSNGGVEVCDGVDNDCDGDIDEGVTNACGQCGPTPQEVCDGVDNDCDGSVDDGAVCGGYVQQRCRLFAGWADSRRGPLGASSTWELCPNLDRDNSGDVRCVGTRRDGRFARLQLLGDVNTDDQMAVALLCDDNNNAALASYIETHCALYVGHADRRQGVDRSPSWGDCPAAASGDNGRQRCTSTGFDRRFRAVELEGDVNDDDQLGVAWICRDSQDPQRAAGLTSAVSVFLGWSDRNGGPADGSATWGACPGQVAGVSGGLRCTSTQGDGLFHLLQLGGDVNDDDQLGWALRAR